MQEKDQIAQLFKDTFNDYEAPVRPELWQQVASKIQTPPAAPSVPDGASVAKMAAASSKMTGGIMVWVAAAAVVVSVATGYYFHDRQQNAVSGTTQQEMTPELNTPAVQGVQNENSPATGQIATPTNSGSKQSQVSASVEPVIAPASGATSDKAIENQEATVAAGVPNQQAATQIETSNTVAPEKSNAANSSNTLSNNTLNTTEPVASKHKIQALPTSGYAPLEVNFTASIPGDGNEWLFGDGSEPLKGAIVRHSFNIPGNYLVTLKNTDENGKTFTELVKIEVLSDLTISNIPNIFTPNGDGVNDVFAISTSKDIDIEVSIFDKSGKFVHKYSGVENSWNGKINNLQDAEAGTYFYVIFATGQNGEKNTQKGTVTLKR